jgi:hypothetical protein
MRTVFGRVCGLRAGHRCMCRMWLAAACFLQAANLSVTLRVATALMRLCNNATACERLARSSMSSAALCRSLADTLKDQRKLSGSEVVGPEGLTRSVLLTRILLATCITVNSLSACAVTLARGAGPDTGAVVSLGKYGLVGVAVDLADLVTKPSREGSWDVVAAAAIACPEGDASAADSGAPAADSGAPAQLHPVPVAIHACVATVCNLASIACGYAQCAEDVDSAFSSLRTLVKVAGQVLGMTKEHVGLAHVGFTPAFATTIAGGVVTALANFTAEPSVVSMALASRPFTTVCMCASRYRRNSVFVEPGRGKEGLLRVYLRLAPHPPHCCQPAALLLAGRQCLVFVCTWLICWVCALVAWHRRPSWMSGWRTRTRKWCWAWQWCF